MRCVWWVALVAGLVLGESRLSFHPPIYLYEFGDLSDQPVHFVAMGHMKPGQRFARVDLKPSSCVRGVRSVRVAVLNAHNPARVHVRRDAVHVHYSRADRAQSTYLVWASRSGARGPGCLHRGTNMISNNRKHLQNQMKQPTAALHARRGYAHYPSRVTSPQHGRRQEWSDEDPVAVGRDFNVETRNKEGTLTKHNAREAKQEEELAKESSESSENVADEINNGVLNKENDKEKYELKPDPIWKLKPQRKNNVNNARESKTQVNSANIQDIEDPLNITETVEFGRNATIFRRTSPVRTVKEQIIEEYITPEEFLSHSTIPSGVSVIPGFTYQFFPSSSEAAANLPPPPEHLPKDQNEWDAYFKGLMDNNSSMIATEKPTLAAAASSNK